MNRKTIRRIVLSLAVVFVVAVFIFNSGRMADHREALRQTPPAPESPSPSIAVVQVSAATHQARVEGFGSAESRFDLSLNSRVSGQVETVHASFESGRLISSGTVLASLEDSHLQASLESARDNEARARVSFMEEQQELQQAQQEWSSSGLPGEPLSTLVLREPQLASAKTALDSARQAVAAAENDLAGSEIKAPFDAIVVSRGIAPGSYIQTGTEIGRLLSADKVEIAIPLSAGKWSVLPDEAELLSGDYPVELLQAETNTRWSGSVVRIEKHLSSSTRQRSLVVAVDRPFTQNPPLYPGTFLKARISGRAVANLWKLPASALSQRGDIWIVTADNLLKAHPAEILFSDQEHIYVQPPEGYPTAQVVIQPLSSYSEGMRVHPKGEITND